ncbi:T9SS C-terminal target domain-containing protein [Paludibacter sp. 221]|uniref:CBM96 family carbohydrate-binding protein n=1 Tax=Paludibacter sp. 221 TaxID=2302939 RepID=UPI0013D0E084|nr:T9SS type A sorting domain-containing protein [Paludibacter sp. 221]NDV46618.1 T9SS C-terminal target domain-containing protein [Paludibacter sp. 221]
MKKLYSFFILILFMTFGLSQSLTSQTQILGGLITVSDTEEHWYYIGNGHSSDTGGGNKINDSDGRFNNLITSPSVAGTIVSTYTLLPNAARDSQKWKVVPSDLKDYYYLVNKESKYLVFTTQYETVGADALPTDKATYRFQITDAVSSTPSSWVKIKLESKNYIGMLNSGGNFNLENNSNAPASVLANGLTSNPRAWQFYAAADVENTFPTTYSENTAKENVIDWFYIRSLDSSISGGEKYLTIDPVAKTFSLAAKTADDKDNQLFGFVSGGILDKVAKTKIISKATGEQLTLTADKLATEEQGLAWLLKLVYSTNNKQQPLQLVFRTAAASGKILKNTLSDAQPNWAKTFDAFDNEYAWAVGKIVPLAVTKGDNITIVTGADGGEVECNQPYTITYTVADGYAPIVTVNNVIHPSGTLDGDGVYTVAVNVKGDSNTIDISAEAANEVTVTKDDCVTILSPVLDGDGKFVAASASAIEFTLAEGYIDPVVEVTGATKGELTFENETYKQELTAVQNGATVSISATLKSLNVTLTKSDGITWEGEPATSISYGGDYTLSFTLAAGYHDLYVVMNKTKIAFSEEGGVYTATLPAVKEDFEAKVVAFAENVHLVAGDTYVDGRTTDGKYFTSETLQVQASTSSYVRITYLEFDLDADAIKAEGYNKAYLKLAHKSMQTGKSADPILQIRTVPSTLGLLSDMTWTVNGEATGVDRKGDPIGGSVTFDRTSPVGEVIEFDVSDIMENLESSLRLQVTGLEDNDAGFLYLYSREGAFAENNMDYMPVLVFEKAIVVTVKENENITILYPEAEGPYDLEEGDSFKLEFTVADGYRVDNVLLNGVDATDEELSEAAGVYTLELKDVRAAVSVEIMTVLGGTGFDEKEEAAITLYTQGDVLFITTGEATDVEIYSALGRLVMKETVVGTGKVQLSKGVYLVKTGNKVSKIQL